MTDIVRRAIYTPSARVGLQDRARQIAEVLPWVGRGDGESLRADLQCLFEETGWVCQIGYSIPGPGKIHLDMHCWMLNENGKRTRRWRADFTVALKP